MEIKLLDPRATGRGRGKFVVETASGSVYIVECQRSPHGRIMIKGGRDRYPEFTRMICEGSIIVGRSMALNKDGVVIHTSPVKSITLETAA